MNLLAGTYTVTDTVTGRGALNLAPVIGGTLQNLNFVFYVVKGSKVFMMNRMSSRRRLHCCSVPCCSRKLLPS